MAEHHVNDSYLADIIRTFRNYKTLGEAALAQVSDPALHSRLVEALDFDTVLPGHSGAGTKADFGEYRQYFEDLQAVVSEAFAAGTSTGGLARQ